MNDLLNLYTVLLTVYTEQVQKLEKIKDEHTEKHRIQWIPHAFLNSRIFTYDEYLQNPFYGGICFEEKNLIMPHLVRFIVTYENSSEESKNEFEKQKPVSEYQKYLHELIPKNTLFIDFLKGQLHQLQELEYRCKIPSPPKRSNATRQLAKYKVDRAEYHEKVDSLNRCRNEVKERIKLVEEISGN
jgi:hypothetical protein